MPLAASEHKPSPHPSLHIRPAIQQDYGAIASIYNEAIAQGGITMDTQLSTAKRIQAIASKMTDREILLVGELAPSASVPNPVVGWGVIKRYSDRVGYDVCCETSIYLSFSARGKGYGPLLQSALMTQVKAYGYRHIVAKILADNQGSIRFHQRFGFDIVGTQNKIGFINNTWHDVVIMQCLIS
ncbi:MAG: N-acetyltransferase family protein [Cyanobacteria bacterium P01_A01_bin.116]